MTAPGGAPAGPLSGVRGLLLDLDGVLILQGAAIAGAPEAMAELDRRSIPYRVVTNTSLVSRTTLSSWGRRVGGRERLRPGNLAGQVLLGVADPSRMRLGAADRDARRDDLAVLDPKRRERHRAGGIAGAPAELVEADARIGRQQRQAHLGQQLVLGERRRHDAGE